MISDDQTGDQVIFVVNAGVVAVLSVMEWT